MSSADLGWRETARRLVDAADASARAPRRWLAGFAYQFLALGWAFGVVAALPLLAAAQPDALSFASGLDDLGARSLFDTVMREGWAVGSVLGLLLALRFAPGLARAMEPSAGARPAAGPFRLGRGFAVSTLALWLQVVVTMVVAGALAVGLLTSAMDLSPLDPDGPLPKVGAGVLLAFLLAYGATLGALYHLAVASLVRHRRGAGSALLHAWRLVRSEPVGAARAVVVDAAAYAALVYVESHVPGLARLGVLSVAIVLVVEGAAGAARAGYWSRTYAALGGVELIAQPSPPGPGVEARASALEEVAGRPSA